MCMQMRGRASGFCFDGQAINTSFSTGLHGASLKLEPRPKILATFTTATCGEVDMQCDN